jgi:hypothetical protein
MNNFPVPKSMISAEWKVHRIPGNFTIEQKGNKDLSYD